MSSHSSPAASGPAANSSPVGPVSSAAPDIAIVVPVFKERANVAILHDKLAAVLANENWELLFVDDDSPDGTSDVCRQLGRIHPRVRVLQRIGRIGLASACVEGMLATTAPFVVIMDGDLQHDETIIPDMIARLRRETLDLVVASRNVAGGSMGEFAAERVKLSQMGRALSNLVLKTQLSDPMSGFFAVRQSFVLEVVRRLSQSGFKILLDLVASSPRPVRLAEVPFTFKTRVHGESKLDFTVQSEYLLLLLDKMLGGVFPVRYIQYALVGLSGVAVQLAAFLAVSQNNGGDVRQAQVVATFLAIVWNFFLNNKFTFRDRRLKGAASIAKGLAVYLVICSAGAFASAALTGFLASAHVHWLLSAICGILVSSVWNFWMASIFTWKILQHRARFADYIQAKRQQSPA